MKVSKEHQEWVKQYAQSLGIGEDEALNKLIDDVRKAHEVERENLQKQIIERLPNLNLEQLREVYQIVDKFLPSFVQFIQNVLKK